MDVSSGSQTLQERLARLQELTEFTDKCQEQLDDLIQTLGWSADHQGPDREAMEQCPYDPNHRVPVRTMENHKASCRLRRLGYSAEEQAEIYDPAACYEKTSISSFKMDKTTQQQVILQARTAAPLMRMEGVFWQGDYSSQPLEVPENHKRAICDLSVADRLALYDHVSKEISQQKDQAAATANEDLYVDLVAKLKKDEQQKEPKSHLELMAEMRDYKRRRQSYRAKNVHITKKSYTEVIREVIDVHSDELSRQWREEEKEEKEVAHSSHRRRSDDEHSSHGKSRRSRERSQDREERRKRRRDSRSPNERHHERKKKKKKKKDEKEK